MDGIATKGETAPAVEEVRLARAAAAGDSAAFVVLYERYEQRAFNLAFRIVGSEADAAEAVQEAFLSAMRTLPGLIDREPAFASYLFAATRNACHEMMGRRHATQHSETTVPPESEEEIREANMRLPDRQREALALRELEELSYDEIAAIMEVNRNTVAQLISRARINLSDELHGAAVASVAPSAECERALPLIAMRDDEQLDGASRDAAWLDAHLADCDRCRLGVEAMRDAGASYRTWELIVAPPWLLKETMAKAAELAGVDWGAEIAEAAATRASGESLPTPPSVNRVGKGRGKRPRRRAAVAVSLVALLLFAGLAAALTGDDPPVTPAGTTPEPSIGKAKPAPKSATASEAKRDAGKKTKTRTIAAPALTSELVPTGGGAPSEPASPNGSSGKTAVQPTQQTPASTRKPKPTPTSTPAPQPATAPTPVAEEPPPAGATGKGPPKKHEPPGKK
jgi:RNA polymerase sigma-70 factor (ECF subfamily)